MNPNQYQYNLYSQNNQNEENQAASNFNIEYRSYPSEVILSPESNRNQGDTQINYIDSGDTNEFSSQQNGVHHNNNYNSNYSTDFYYKRPPLEVINEMKSEYSHDSVVYKRPLSKQDNEYLLTSSKNKFYNHSSTANLEPLNQIDEEGG
mmetsp:Transcript_10062/g.10374  ORF Transcript_10062/g.10374 Transcript_10062/m.10374 type:complete len:149 (+) Transcript_10062:169-615(+)